MTIAVAAALLLLLTRQTAHSYVSSPLTGVSHHDRRGEARALHSSHMSQGNNNDIALRVGDMRASQMKSLMKTIPELSNTVKSMYEKGELMKVLLEYEDKLLKSSNVLSIPLHSVNYDHVKKTKNVPNYIGIDLLSAGVGTPDRFMVDTGATMNLCKASLLRDRPNDYLTQAVTSHGLSGTGTISAKTTTLQQLSVRDVDGVVHAVGSAPAAILENSQALPSEVQGLLSIKFLATVGNVIQFDFTNSKLNFHRGSGASNSALLSPVKKLDMDTVQLIRGFDGLLTCDVYIENNVGPIRSLVDIGSCYTIFNYQAVRLLGESAVSRLKPTDVKVAGIDNSPVGLQALTLSRLSLGGNCEVVGSSGTGDFRVFVGEVAGLKAVLLGSPTPAGAILGMDVFLLYKTVTLDLSNNKMFLSRH